LLLKIVGAAALAGFELLSLRAVAAVQSSSSQGQTAGPRDTLDSLRSRINAVITNPAFDSAQWGIKVVELDSGKPVFEHRSGSYFNPASNTKLFTAALALDRLGPDYRIKTTLYSTAAPDSSGRIRGDLIVYGRGDPTIAARLNGGDYYKALEPLVAVLEGLGVKRIGGDLIGDESFFRGAPFGSGWEWDSLQWYYGAEVSALSVNDNSVDLFVKPGERVGQPCRITTGPPLSPLKIINRTATGPKNSICRISVYRPVGDNVVYVSGCIAANSDGFTGFVAVHNPANYFVLALKELLAERGITVTGRVRTMDWKSRDILPLDTRKLRELGSVESLPMRDIIRETLKPSQNLWAQLLLLQVGTTVWSNGAEASRDGAPAGSPVMPTTEENGVESLNEFTRRVGLKRGEVVIEEGSGLSRRNLVTPNSVVALLQFMDRHRSATVYRDALPVAGVDGTLKNRLRDTPAAGNVRAKTGTLRYVNTLSGYLTTLGEERLAFSIMLNNFNADGTISAREAVDQIVGLLAGFNGKTTS
jgi:D-alanyl-D-alanine carboxypeptidase/D-alanyl-D-alanine-endopeptidase (penicillin-binding protein 4)